MDIQRKITGKKETRNIRFTQINIIICNLYAEHKINLLNHSGYGVYSCVWYGFHKKQMIFTRTPVGFLVEKQGVLCEVETKVL
jgi:hypothetical protein